MVTVLDSDAKMERQDANIKKMAKLLREGARMLDLACPVCNNPIFQLKTGEKICIACERKVVFESELQPPEKKSEPSTQIEKAPKPEPSIPYQSIPTREESKNVEASDVFIAIKRACLLKLVNLADKMKSASDDNQVAIISSNILKLLEILEKLRLA